MKMFGINFFEGTADKLCLELTQRVENKIKTKIAFCDLNMLGEISLCSDFNKLLSNFDFVLADGSSVVLLQRIFKPSSPIFRIPGPDFFKSMIEKDPLFTHFFLGSSDIVLKNMTIKAKAINDKLKVAGTYSPVFENNFSSSTIKTILDRVNPHNPEFLWVSFGCPKQEIFIEQNFSIINSTIFAAVGAAFDFYSGVVRRAPLFFRTLGVEFVYRFFSQPRTVKRIFRALFRVIFNIRNIYKP